ncbi:basic amino acid ABC transporter substrate-binding protein [soil metagenome]
MTSPAHRPHPLALGALLSLALLGGCAANGAERDTVATGPALVTPGTLTVCSDMPYEPFESLKDGKPFGFDIDLVRKVADNLHLEAQFKDTDFDAIQSGDALNSGACDIAISAMTITGERARVLDFSSPYFNASQALVLDKGSDVTSLEDLGGKRIAVQGGTTGELYVTDNAPSTAKVVPLKDAAAMEQALKERKVDAAVYDNTVVGDVVANNPKLQVAAQFDTGEQYGMAVKKDGNVPLLRSINRALATVKKDGGYSAVYTTWFGSA